VTEYSGPHRPEWTSRAPTRWAGVLCTVVGLLHAAAAAADAVSAQRGADLPVISIVIDDLGNRWDNGLRAVNLPGPVACAFLPRSHFTPALARLAHSRGKEVMLHLPMESVGNDALDDGGLTLDMSEQQFQRTLDEDLDAVPYVSGVNNHMGSLLTRHPGHMLWLMEGIRRHGGLFFVDSRTTSATVALMLARENDVPSTERKVFLDSEPGADVLKREFSRLVQLARREGAALGIGHPHPDTLALLEGTLGSLENYGVRLVPVSRLIDLQQGRVGRWQASLYR
jgi:polysaccharide deacetylase 2 family uncharacterized protein YibQ